MKKVLTKMSALACAAAVLGLMLSGCGNGSSDTVTVAGDVPLAYVKRAASVNQNPTNGAPSAAGGDLLIREKSSPSAEEFNVTASITQGAGDASDPEVSYDGKKIVFSLRCPTTNTSTVNGQPACTGHWNIWEYDMSAGLKNGSFRRLTASTQHDDVDPAYLPAGRGFVFTSNRQTQSRLKQGVGPTEGYYALDEYERERVFNLHTMNAQGEEITQISVNQSHDRNPVVRPNGDIMFSRWDHVGGRNHFKVFRVKPDGTDMFVLYGAHSEGNSFLHPRDMDPNGPYKGQVSSDLMPLSRTHEGGALVFVDAANYSEQNTPANASVPTTGGQKQVTADALSTGGGLSLQGRVTTPYPLWDGTNRVLMAYTPCQVTKNGVTVLCASLSSEELATVAGNDMTPAQAAAAPIRNNARPAYSIYMFDPAKQSMLPVASPPPGFIYTDPIALQARTEPNATDPAIPDATLAGQGMGLLDVRSVYDTDGLGRMGDQVIGAIDRLNGCTNPIPKIAPTSAEDTRAQVADLVKLKTPTDAAYGCAPARFIRVMRAVPPPSSTMGLRSAIGETDFEPQQILGYVPIEPDGSFKIKVPADVPLGLAVVDAKGRAFQTHTNWIQVRPGEKRTCDGCHSPRRGGALNSGAVVNTMPAGLVASLAGARASGETMADTRTRLNPALLNLVSDMVSTDVWADTTQPGVTARPAISVRYAGNPNAADDLDPSRPAAIPVNGIINYPEHVQPLWDRVRAGGASCSGCHSDPTTLDLTANVAGTGRVASYERLMIGDPLIDTNTGLPVFTIRDGVPEIEREPALVDTGASEGEALGLTRKSRLAEVLFGENMFAGADTRTIYPDPPAGTNHATLLNAAEKRLVAEWIDLGSKYYNDPFNGSSGVRTLTSLSQASFESTIYPIIQANCASACHQAIGSTATPAGTSFRQNRYVLTGDAEGDFNVTLTMISNVCTPAANYLLSRPSTVPHPAGAVTQAGAILPVGSANYTTIANWIRGACTTP